MFSQLYFNRWIVLANCLLGASVGATAYAFGVYSRDLATALNYDQKSIDLVASAGELGLYLQVLCGMLMGYVGPRVTLIVGMVLIFFGFQYLYLAGTHVIDSSLGLVAGMLFVSQLGTSCLSVTMTAVSIRNFPKEDRGKAAGLAKAYFALSSAILSQLYHDFYDGRAVEFLRFLSFFIPVVLLIVVSKINVLHHSHVSYGTEKRLGIEVSFDMWFSHLAVLLLYVLMIGIVGQLYKFTNAQKIGCGIVTLFLQFSVLVLPHQQGKMNLAYPISGVSKTKTAGPYQAPIDLEEEKTFKTSCIGTEQESLLTEYQIGTSVLDNKIQAFLPEGAQVKNLTILQALQERSFWILFSLFFCSAGSGLIVINNVPQIAESLGLSSSSFLVSLIGICNCLGRATIGWFSDQITKYLPRTALLCLVVSFMGVTCFVFSLSMPIVLYPCVILTAFFYGGTFALLAALAGDIFGPEHVATIYGALDLSPALGSFFFATWVVNLFYTEDCAGCFSNAFVIAGIMCLVASFMASFILVDHSKINLGMLKFR